MAVGDHDLEDKNEGQESWHTVVNVFRHPKYVNHNHDWLEWDFAILELEEEGVGGGYSANKCCTFQRLGAHTAYFLRTSHVLPCGQQLQWG